MLQSMDGERREESRPRNYRVPRRAVTRTVPFSTLQGFFGPRKTSPGTENHLTSPGKIKKMRDKVSRRILEKRQTRDLAPFLFSLKIDLVPATKPFFCTDFGRINPPTPSSKSYTSRSLDYQSTVSWSSLTSKSWTYDPPSLKSTEDGIVAGPETWLDSIVLSIDVRSYFVPHF